MLVKLLTSIIPFFSQSTIYINNSLFINLSKAVSSFEPSNKAIDLSQDWTKEIQRLESIIFNRVM